MIKMASNLLNNCAIKKMVYLAEILKHFILDCTKSQLI